MSFGRHNFFWKRIGVRLWLWYSGIFIAIAIVLLTISHIGISSVLINNDHKLVQAKTRELVRLYNKGGIEEIESDASLEEGANLPDAIFVRIAGSQNQTLLSKNEDAFGDFHLPVLEKDAPVSGQWITVREAAQDDELELLKQKEVLEVRTERLPDGNYLQVGKSSEYREDFLANFRLIFAAIVVPIFLVAGTLLSLRSLSPLRTMISTVQMIQDGKLESRVPTRNTGDELDQLAKLFNGMLEQIEKLIHGMRSSLDAVAHDLRTPITRLRVVAETALQSEPNTEKYQEALADCLEESERIDKLLNVLMDISEAETGSMKLTLQSILVPALIEDSVELYRYVAEGKDIQITTQVPADLTFRADWNRLRQVLANLLDNAIKYTEAGGRIHVEAYRNGSETIIQVQDSGIGIAPEDLPRIWDRLYRSDRARSQKGIGLGLSLVRAVVAAHGGRVEATSEPGKGSTFTLAFS